MGINKLNSRESPISIFGAIRAGSRAAPIGNCIVRDAVK